MTIIHKIQNTPFLSNFTPEAIWNKTYATNGLADTSLSSFQLSSPVIPTNKNTTRSQPSLQNYVDQMLTPSSFFHQNTTLAFAAAAPLLILGLLLFSGCAVHNHTEHNGCEDFDMDGYVSVPDLSLCEGYQLTDYKEGAGDCDDFDDQTFPEASEEPYDGIDQDCDGFDLTDVDEDGFDSWEVYIDDCNTLENCDEYEDFMDCDDYNPEIYPGANEVFDGLDNDCDGWID